MDSRLEQAKEWAWGVTSERIPDTSSGRAKLAAAKVIQSLPDHIIDADDLREWMNDYIQRPWNYGPTVDDLLTDLQSRFLTPSLPTLAELIEAGNDSEDYQWAWVDTEDGLQVISMAGNFDDKRVYTMDEDGFRFARDWSEIRPRPDLPRLEWPAQVPRNPETPPAETLNNASSDTPRKPRPEDVPAGEAWLVRYKGRELDAYKADRDRHPWVIHLSDKEDYWRLSDAEITLISRLVPEHKENA